MLKNEVAKHKYLNHLAEANGIVIFGGKDDVHIPLCELKQAFALNDSIYNRSFSELLVADATKVYCECIGELCPDTILLHIGDVDVSELKGKEATFKKNYITLINTIRENNADCRIIIVSLKNYDNNITVDNMNRILKEIADDEKCEFEDISTKRNCNVKKRSEVTSFIYDIGFDRPLNIKRPIYNLVRILFCYAG